VILVTRHPWPAVRGALDALHAQAAAIEAEIIVGVSDPAAIPVDAAEAYPGVSWVEERDASVFRLRSAALARCRAEIVAITEDHAWVAPDWCEQILASHARYPAAAAIGGVVENGATRSIRDWAGFFVAGGAFASPIQNGAARAISQQANVSYKRRMLPTDLPSLGLMSHTLHEDLRRSGATLVADDRLIAHHVQELSLAQHSAGHFHNGRSIAGFRAARMRPWMRAARMLGCTVLPPLMLWRTLAALVPKRRYTRELLAGLPLVAWFLCCHATGELFGYAAGAGNSPERVE
jgi:hypothetical protein